MDATGAVDSGPVLPMHLRGLMHPQAYPHPVDRIELIETPLSWVLLAGPWVYKLKRPVRYPFVDQRCPTDRKRLCHEELRLNRRFAPALYVAVCTVVMAQGSACIDAPGEPLEYAVRMHRFDRTEQLDQLVLQGRVGEGEIEQLGAWLAQCHRTLPGGAHGRDAGSPAAVSATVARNAAECLNAATGLGSGPRIAQLATLIALESAHRAAALAWRRANQRIRECHADLHLSNVVRLDGRLQPFDCLEFDPALRWIDTALDVAFLYADLLGYRARGLANRLLNAYLSASGDYHALRLLPLYVADRALVRAKVLALQTADPGRLTTGALELLKRRHERYLTVAEQALQRRQPRCLMMAGLPGSGKSWLAERLAEPLEAVVVRSDVERKRLAGLAARDASHSAPGGGWYAGAHSDQVYERLSGCAADALDGGRDVIVDATFDRRPYRTLLAATCRSQGAALSVVHCQAPEPALRERILARQAAAQDPSEADPAVLSLKMRAWQPLSEEEGLSVVAADTRDANVLAGVLERLRPIRQPGATAPAPEIPHA